MYSIFIVKKSRAVNEDVSYPEIEEKWKLGLKSSKRVN